jgi:hypothetical protein
MPARASADSRRASPSSSRSRRLPPCPLCALVKYVLIIALALFAFYIGSLLVSQAPSRLSLTPSPTPTPDTRASLNQPLPVDYLKLAVTQATRVLRPEESNDLGVVTVKFNAVSPCGETGSPEPLCTFQTSAFTLTDDRSRGVLSTTPPPNKYIRDLVLRPLTASRSLHPLISETGQLYFLLPKTVNDFTLTYTSPTTQTPVRFRLNFSLYPHQESGVPVCR